MAAPTAHAGGCSVTTALRVEAAGLALENGPCIPAHGRERVAAGAQGCLCLHVSWAASGIVQEGLLDQHGH